MRNSFRTPLIVEVMESGKKFKLVYPFTQKHRIKRGEWVILEIPRGFVTDFASIPRLARLIIPKLGRHTKASVVHDYLYQYHNVNVHEADRTYYTYKRKVADDLFLEGMIDLGVRHWKANLMYYGVRAFGWLAWHK